MTQSKLRSIIIALSMAALTVPMGCAIPDINQPADTPDTGTSTDVGDTDETPAGGDSDTNAGGDNADPPDTPAAGVDTDGGSVPGDTDASPGAGTADPNPDTEPQPGDGEGDGNGNGDGAGDSDVPPPGGGTQDPGGGDDGGNAPLGDTIRADLEFDGPDGSRVEMNPLLPSLVGSGTTSTQISVSPATIGFVTFLCDDTISLGAVSFFDASGGVITLNDVIFDHGTDFECGQTVTLRFSLPSVVSLIAP